MTQVEIDDDVSERLTEIAGERGETSVDSVLDEALRMYLKWDDNRLVSTKAFEIELTEQDRARIRDENRRSVLLDRDVREQFDPLENRWDEDEALNRAVNAMLRAALRVTGDSRNLDKLERPVETLDDQPDLGPELAKAIEESRLRLAEIDIDVIDGLELRDMPYDERSKRLTECLRECIRTRGGERG